MQRQSEERQRLLAPRGQIGFVGKDVARALGYKRPSDVILAHVEDEDKMLMMIQTADTQNAHLLNKTKTAVISESGLYSLILSSKKAEAKEFKHWVTSVVLVQIRQTGSYSTAEGQEENSTILLLRKAVAMYERTIELKDEVIDAQRPKVEFANVVGTSTDICTLAELAKLISNAGVPIGQNRLCEWKREHKYLGRSRHHWNTPYQEWVDQGLFVVKTHQRAFVRRGYTYEVTLLIRKAFDNSLHGLERVGSDSVSGIAPLRWNWNASTTLPNARRFFSRAVNDGTVSRLDVCSIFKEENATSEIPVMGIYDDQFALELKSFNDHLDCASGLIECPQANALAIELVKESHSTADQMESEAFRTLARRGVVIAWLKGLVLYISEGYRWTPEIADFMRWSLHYNTWCKMLYFGQQLEAEMVEEKKILNQYGPQNLLMSLPAEFTKEEYYQLRSRCGKEGKGDSTLRVWISRGYVVWDEIANRFINKRIRASGQ